MEEVDVFDEPLGDDKEVNYFVFEEEEEKALKALIEINGPLVEGFTDRLKAEECRVKDPKIERDEKEVDLAMELASQVFHMRMTFQNLIQSASTVFPLQLVHDIKKVETATCLDDLENVFGPTEGDIDDLLANGGDMADLLERFPQISLKVKDDRSNSEGM